MHRLHLLIKTRSPLHIAAPGDLRADPQTGKYMYGSKVGIPCTSIQRMSIHTPDGLLKLPVIAANNVAGHLRRHGAALVLEALAAKEQKVSLSTYAVLQCGAATGFPDGGSLRYQEYKEAVDHPYLGLFGGGPKLIRRGFRLSNALPLVEQVRELLGNLGHPCGKEHEITVGAKQLAQILFFRRMDDLRELANVAQMETSIEDFQASFEARQTLILEDEAKGRDEAGSNTSTKTFQAMELVLPGVVFDMSADLFVNPAQMGLFLLSLDRFAAQDRLGGQSRNGFGQFSLEDVRLIDPAGDEHVGIFHNGRLNRQHPALQNALQAWDVAREKLDAAQLDALVPLPVKKDKKGKKAAEAA